MREIETRLRDYLDHVVERVDADDVFARANVRRQWLAPPARTWHPVWVAGAAASLVILAIGAVAAGAWLLRTDVPPDYASQPGAAGSPVSWTGVLMLGLAIGGGTIAILAGATALSNLIHRMRDRRNPMQTIESPEVELTRLRRENARLGKTKRSLVIALVVLVVAVAGTAAWLIIDNAGTTTERQLTALVDDYYAAWTAADGEAVLDLMTEEGVLRSVLDDTTYTGAGLRALVDSSPSFNPERVGDLIIIDTSTSTSSAWLVASQSLGPDYYGDAGDWQALEIFTIVERDGRLLIEVHESWPVLLP